MKFRGVVEMHGDTLQMLLAAAVAYALLSGAWIS